MRDEYFMFHKVV